MNLVARLRGRGSLVALVVVAAMAYGALALRQLPSGIYPEVEFPRIVVVARVGDLPPEVVQTAATRPLEEAIATVPNMRRLRSRTIRGATELSVQFESGSDMWRTLQLVEAHVAEIRGELPANTELRIERVTPAALPILTLAVSGEVDPRVLREVATRVIRPALIQVAGVGAIEVQGGDVRELEVILKPAALAGAHLTPTMVADRLSAGDRIAAVGRAYADHQVLAVLAASEPKDLAALPIGDGLTLGSVADVIEGSEDRAQSVAGPHGDSVVISVSRAVTASAPDVVAGARAVIAQLERDKVLPPGVQLEAVYDQAVLIDDAMTGVRDAILLGIALAMVVLAVFLRDLRAGIAAAITIPITLICTFGVMKLAGQTLNLMSLGGLAVAIGLIVDDAIVIVEAIVHRLEEGATVREAAEQGTRDLFAAVVGTTATTVVVFAPLLWLEGVVGSFFSALAVTLSAAVILSMVVALTVVPLVGGRILRARPVRPPGRIARGYGSLVRRVVAHPILSVVAVLALGAGGVLAARAAATGFLPAMDEGAFVLDFFLPAGTSLEETDQIMRRVDAVLVRTPEIAAFTRRTGAEMGPAAATQQNRGDVLVRLVARGKRGTVYEVMDGVRKRMKAAAPEARIELVQVLQDVLDDLSGNPKPIEIQIFGPDPLVRQSIAAEVGKRIHDVAELDDVFDGVEGQVPNLRIDVDPAATRRLGVDPAVVIEDLDVGIAGRIAAYARIEDRRLGVRVRFPDEVRFSPDAIARIVLPYAGTSVPLAALSTLSRPVGPAVLSRENLAPVVIASAAIQPGGDLAGATATVTEKLADLKLPAGYRLAIGGQLASARATQRDLARVFGLGVALVLAILVLQLGSLRLALVVLLGAPLALVGAFVTLVAFDIPVNASSLMGCVLLAGLVVKNGILLLERARELAHAGVPFAEALAQSGQRRLRPIVMTTAASVAGLLPLAFAFGAGSELQRPLAVATVGGLLLSTLVTLFALPALAALVVGRGSAVPAGEPARGVE